MEKLNVIGSDETGVGDYLTPLVVSAVFVPFQNLALFKSWNVIDSKKLSDQQIKIIYEKIKTKIKSSTHYLLQSQYNFYNKNYNANELKMLLHLQAIGDLSSKLDQVDLAIIDQFATKNSMDKYRVRISKDFNLKKSNFQTIYVTRGEEYHISVAAASIVARITFLKLLDQQNQKWKTTFPLGTNQRVEMFARDFIKKHGFQNLKKVAKLSFKTTQNVLK